MLKPEKINWKDTNLALIGSDLDKKIKKAAAENEPQWNHVGEAVELRVWRIEQFIVKAWPKSKYGKFHTGDSYVILNTYQPDPSKPKLAFDVHIWIGDESSQDEYGTAAYKMVELDDKLGGAAVQHREVQAKESQKFRGYFKKGITYLAGGVESGFKHVEPSAAEPHLYHVKGTKGNLIITQLPVRKDQLNSGDVFILTAGEDKVWLWIGSEANAEEKAKGREVARSFCKKGNVKVLDQGKNDGESEEPEFWEFLPRKAKTMGLFSKSMHIKAADDLDSKVKSFNPVLFQLPDAAAGSLSKVASAKPVHTGPTNTTSPRIKRKELNQKHGYLLDTGFHVFVWLGTDVKRETKVSAVPQSHEYFKKNKRPLLPVTLLKSGQEGSDFNDFFYDAPEESSCCTIM
uniref:Gelsolin-like domain-containing protein n=1 Tax=Pseudictyota dubia TaxID=2749911 RepID=A0A7R9VD60_9STRA